MFTHRSRQIFLRRNTSSVVFCIRQSSITLMMIVTSISADRIPVQRIAMPNVSTSVGMLPLIEMFMTGAGSTIGSEVRMLTSYGSCIRYNEWFKILFII